MPIGTPTQIGNSTVVQTSGQTSAAMSIGTPGAGTLVVVMGDLGNATGQPTSVVDTDGNNYVQAVADARSDNFASIWYFFYASAASGEQTVTVSFASCAFSVFRAWSVSGITSTTPLDVTASANGFTDSATVTASGDTAQADEIVFACLGQRNDVLPTWPPSTGYTDLGLPVGAVRGDLAGFAYKIVSAVETPSVTATLDGSQNWAIMLATFKGAAAGATDFPLDAQPGAYAVTGTAASPLADRVVAANAGSFAVTGTAASPVAGRVVSASPGAYAVTGSEATFLRDLVLSADAGAYTLTGRLAGALADRILSADAGAYTLTGVLAELLLETPGAFELNAESGSYTVSGAAASLIATRLLSADPGTYVLTGSQAGVLAGHAVSADPGAFSVTGTAATPLAARLIVGAPGAYTLTGSEADLVLLGAGIGTPPNTSRTRVATLSGFTVAHPDSGLTRTAAHSGRTQTNPDSGETGSEVGD